MKQSAKGSPLGGRNMVKSTKCQMGDVAKKIKLERIDGKKSKKAAPSWSNVDDEDDVANRFDPGDSEEEYEDVPKQSLQAKRSQKAKKTQEKQPEDSEDSEESEDNEDKGMDDSEKSSSDEDDDDDDSDEDDDAEEARRQLADVPFEVLQQLQRDGSHVGASIKRDTKEARKKAKAEKGAPVEQSSKKPVKRFRQVVHVNARKGCDPRFERLSGSLNEDLFRKTYSFVAEKRQDEIRELKESLRKTRDSAARQQLEVQLATLQRSDQKEAATARAANANAQRRKTEHKLVEGGKKPFFLKKSDQRILDIAKRYEELKGSKGKVEEAVAKRRKRNAQKDHRYVPYARRSAEQ